MSLFSAFRIAGSAATAQGQRLNVVASNLANADSAAGPQGVRVRQVVTDTSPARRVHDPKHPMADAQGYVSLPNVNVAEEMVNMISAARSYESNIEVMNTARALLQKTLQLGNG